MRTFFFNTGYFLLIYVLSCNNGNAPGEKEVVINDSFFLHNSNRVHLLKLEDKIVRDPPDLLQFKVAIQNVKLEPFSVEVHITDSIEKKLVGNFSAFPLDRGDKYMFRVGDLIKEFSKKRDRKNIYLQFSLLTDKELVKEFSLQVSNIHWVQKLD